MARLPLDPPSAFGKLVSSAIRREMGDRRMSGRALAKAIGKSEAYVRARVADEYEFTLADLEAFTAHIGVSPEDFIANLEPRPTNVTQLRPRVGGSVEDLPAVARPSDPDDGEDQ